MARLTCTSCEVTPSMPTGSVDSSSATALARFCVSPGGPPQQVEATHESQLRSSPQPSEATGALPPGIRPAQRPAPPRRVIPQDAPPRSTPSQHTLLLPPPSRGHQDGDGAACLRDGRSARPRYVTCVASITTRSRPAIVDLLAPAPVSGLSGSSNQSAYGRPSLIGEEFERQEAWNCPTLFLTSLEARVARGAISTARTTRSM